MKTNLNIFLVLILITGACSSSSWLAEGSDDLYYIPEERSEDFAIAGDEGTVHAEATPVAYHEDEQFAYNEYDVSPLDTIWFDEFLVVGTDTLTYEQAYRQFAYQEYGVTPFDTIWFSEYLVVGADTLDYQKVYNRGRNFSLSFYCPGPEYFDLSNRINHGLVLSDVTPFYPLLRDRVAPFFSGLQAGMLLSEFQAQSYGISWNYSAPLISPRKSWIEVIADDSRETSRPLYTYYMGLPPVVVEKDRAPAMRNDRERGVVFHNSVISGIRKFSSP
jgi:hypothetical protein